MTLVVMIPLVRSNCQELICTKRQRKEMIQMFIWKTLENSPVTGHLVRCILGMMMMMMVLGSTLTEKEGSSIEM
jgi:hypothetical protein